MDYAPLFQVILWLAFALFGNDRPPAAPGILCKVPPIPNHVTTQRPILPQQQTPKGEAMHTPDLDLPGRLTATRKRHGDPDTTYAIHLDGQTLFLLQSILEHTAAPEGNYFKTRECVLVAETIRNAVLTRKETT